MIAVMATVFSRIIAGEIPGRFVWSDEKCVVFATIEPITPGHMLVVPRIEVSKFTDATDELLAHLMRVAKIVGRACETAFDAPRAALIIAGFEVPHLHIHVLPAQGEAELSFEFAKPASDAELDEATQKIRKALLATEFAANVPAEMGSAN